MKVINCLQSLENNSLDLRTRLMLAEAFRLVGQSYNEMKLFDQSFENYKQAYEILSPLNDANCLYRAIYDMGRNLMLANKYSQAIEIFHDMFNKATTDNERAFVDQYISFCYLNLNNYDQAKHYAYQALDYAFQSNEELLSIEAYLLLGKIYFKLKDFQRAKDYLQYARNLKDQLGDLNQLNYFDEFLSDIQNHQEKISLTIKDFNSQWISSSMENDENKQNLIDEIKIENKNLSHWRILTPYYQLFCT
jgi:tetratricopeptide (TPR) repeat protein